jgi:tripartite-type tricarboxylate transporter receptor subunit TctC
METRMSWIRIVAAVAALSAATLPGAAQDWPARPVTIVVPLAAGGGPDALARILAPQLYYKLGQIVLVENVPGAGGMIGAARVARAAPDGYQVLIGNVGTNGRADRRPAVRADYAAGSAGK